MAAKNKAVEPEETGTQDNHATVVAQAERKSKPGDSDFDTDIG